MASESSGNVLLNLAAGHRVTAIIYTAAKLGIADLLFDDPKTAAELARLTDTYQPSLLRLMRALVALRICTEAPDGRFELADLGSRLAAQSERSLKGWILVEGEFLRVGWGGLVDSIRTGKTGNELAGLGQERFERMAESKDAATFNEGMAAITRLVMPLVLAACDFSGVSTLMDVGGGLAELMSAVLRKHPSMRGIVFDLPHCAERAEQNLVAAGVAERAEFVAGNFFESVPSGAEAIVLKNIIHDWSDERCACILQNCHRALKSGSRLTVIDRVLPEKVEPTPEHLAALLSDLNMLRGPGGCERTEKEHRALLTANGFRVTRIVPAGPNSLIEATAF
jgi:O-methyltransferase domain/Dimerisation domain